MTMESIFRVGAPLTPEGEFADSLIFITDKTLHFKNI